MRYALAFLVLGVVGFLAYVAMDVEKDKRAMSSMDQYTARICEKAHSNKADLDACLARR